MRRKADFDLLVIGGGPAGIIAARTAADLKARVMLIERKHSGGILVDSGSVPSKALIRSAGISSTLRHAGQYRAIPPNGVAVDFGKVMQRARDLRGRIGGLYSVEYMRQPGVEFTVGEARFVAKDAIEVCGRRLRFEKAVIATGARPEFPQIDGLRNTPHVTGDDVFELLTRPERLLVVGGGPLGCELAQAFCRLGSHVIIAQRDPKFLPREERDAAQVLSECMARDGVEIHLNTRVTAVSVRTDAVYGPATVVTMRRDDEEKRLEVDQVLVGTSRLPNVSGLGLEVAGVRFDERKGIEIDDQLRTTNRRIYAAGDCCMTHRFTHIAAASARMAVSNALEGTRLRFSQFVIPWCTYTDPEIAHVGMQVDEARRSGIAVKTITVLMHEVDRAIIDDDDDGFLKIHVKDGTDQILGATIVASRAGDMINEITLAMQTKIGLSRLANTLHAYPTQALAVKMAADQFARSLKLC